MQTFEELCVEENEPVVVADDNGMICRVNRCFEETFKWKQGDLKGQLLTVIMPAKFRDSHSMGISRFLSTETRSLPEHELTLEVVCGDGSVLMSKHTIVAGKRDGAWGFAGMIIPLTEV
jgi:PAS domain S-box-containing protein